MNQLMQTILQVTGHDAVALTNVLDIVTKLSDPDVAIITAQLQDIKNIFDFVNLLPNVERGMLIEKLEIFSFCENVVLARNPADHRFYDQVYKRRDIVHCRLAGVGREFSKDHFALVWDDDPANEKITVIPTTSQIKLEYADVFDLGVIAGLPPGQTTLLVNDLIRISRKRITSVNGRLHKSWEERIKQAIAVSFGSEVTLETVIRNVCGDSMPINLPLFKTMRFLPIRDHVYDVANQLLHYRKWNELPMQSLSLIRPQHPFDSSRKKTLLKNLYYGNSTQVILAQTDYKHIYLGL